jgi:hypothetical protein
MKKFLTLMAAVVLFVGTTTSCKKCYTCTKDTITGEDTKEVCDYPGSAENRAEALEADGYSCTVE